MKLNLPEKLTDTLQNDLIMVRVYAFLFVFNLIIVLPLSAKATDTIGKRNELKDKLAVIKTDMETKFDQLKQSSVVYSEALTYKKDLDIALPSESDVETYLVSLVETLGKVGYVLTELSADSRKTKGEVYLSLNMEGDPSNIGRLVEALESMPRITEVQDISVNFNQNDNILIIIKILVVEAGNKI